MNQRRRLPNRRYSEMLSFYHDGIQYHGSVSWFPDDTARPAELFLDASKPGSQMQAIARDAAVLASFALQYGAPIEALRDAVTRNDDGTAAGPIGQLIELIARGTK